MNRNTILKYLIECVLIFISVIAAFLFDNERDKRQSRERELDLLREVNVDLINDTIQYNFRIKQATALRDQLTTLIRALETRGESIDGNILFKPIEIVLNKTTYDVIKSTGGFKFILDKELVSGLSEYYNSRQYISEIYTKMITEADVRIGDFLTTNTKYIENLEPQESYLVFSHTIEPQSLNRLRGNQEMINLCYMKRTLLDQMIFVFKRFSIVRSKALHDRSRTYLQSRL